MIARLAALLGRQLLRLRYRIRVVGMGTVLHRGRGGILFLPNHPALIDPPILLSLLAGRFAPRALADQDQVSNPVVRRLAASFGVYPLPSIERYGESCRAEVEQTIARCLADLKAGANLLIYPAGRLKRQRFEDLRGASAVERLLREAPDARVVLVRTNGLWGSSFSYAQDGTPNLGRGLLRGLASVLVNGVFFCPRRDVTVELVEPEDLPRTADRNALNRYLEDFYNQAAAPNTYVPYRLWERGGTRTRPEPQSRRFQGDAAGVPPATRELVLKHLADLTSRPAAGISNDLTLARDLGLDSLAQLDLALWLQSEFGFAVDDATALNSVGDVLLAACGTVLGTSQTPLQPVPRGWSARPRALKPVVVPAGDTIPAVFLRQAARLPGRTILADQVSGGRTYRDMITAVLILKPRLERLPGTYAGIMLPASVGAGVVTLAVQFAGKTPVMVNWTVGARSMVHSLSLLGVERVLTSRRLVQRLETQGQSLSEIRDRFVFIEELGAEVSRWAKLKAAVQARLGWHGLTAATVTDTAVVLFTSGSENLPKAVPLTHANLLANIRDLQRVFRFQPDDRLLGILPPFHSFGINCTTLLPLCCGLPVAYHPNPTESAMLARLVEAYRITLLLGTPTFLNGMVRAATDAQLASLRAVISGAEKCPKQLYETVNRRWPKLVLIEGYGITECSPVVSANDQAEPRPGTIGKLVPSIDHLIVDPETGQPVLTGAVGVLLVRGPSIFGGYLHYQGPSPFVEAAGKSWYRTGDLVREDAGGVLTFVGRLKRFVKLGGEMISLPAIEDVLAQNYLRGDEDEPVLAVESTPVDCDPELVLFTTLVVDRQEVNQRIRAAGLSPLHNIRTVVTVEKIPVLGTGKTDYRALKQRLRQPELAG